MNILLRQQAPFFLKTRAPYHELNINFIAIIKNTLPQPQSFSTLKPQAFPLPSLNQKTLDENPMWVPSQNQLKWTASAAGNMPAGIIYIQAASPLHLQDIWPFI